MVSLPRAFPLRLSHVAAAGILGLTTCCAASAASPADENLQACLRVVDDINRRERELPNGESCRENWKRLDVMQRILADIRKLRTGVCKPTRISGGEITPSEAEKLVDTMEANGKSLADLIKVERSLQKAICR